MPKKRDAVTAEMIDVARLMAELQGITVKQAKKEIEHVFTAITTLLDKDYVVRIFGFGSFETVVKEKHDVKVPTFGKHGDDRDIVECEARKYIKFRMSRALRSVLSEGLNNEGM